MDIKLYVNSVLCDFFNDESINIVQSIKDVSDFSKVFTPFSRSFSLPSSPKNNQIFKYYYKNELINSDINGKLPAQIYIGDILFQNGYVLMENVALKNNNPHSYNVTFYASTVQISELLGENMLKDLDLTAFDHLFNDTNVLAGIRTSVTTGINATISAQDVIYPLISRVNRFVYDDSATAYTLPTKNIKYSAANQNRGIVKEDLKPALKVLRIIDAIKVKFPELNFSTDFFNSTNAAIKDLFLWLNNSKYQVGKTDTSDQAATVVKGFTTSGDTSIATLDTNSSIISFSVGGGLFYKMSATYTPSNTVPYGVKVEDLVTGQTIRDLENLVGIYNDTMIFSGATGDRDIKTTIKSTAGGITVTTAYVLTQTNAVNFPPTYNVMNFSASTNIFLTAYISENMPQIKLVDFVAGLFRMFNLVSYEVDGVIIVKPYNDFLEATEIDLTRYVDISSATIGRPPTHSLVSFSNAKPTTIMAQNFGQNNAANFGNLMYKTGYIGDEYKIETPFEKILMERLFEVSTVYKTTIIYGLSANDKNEAVIPTAVLFHNVPTTSTTSQPIAYYNGAALTSSVTSYNRAANSITDHSLNFGIEMDEWLIAAVPDANTLFYKYHRDYVLRVFDTQQRVITFNAVLTPSIMMLLKLGKVVKITNKLYRINSIDTDLKTGKTKITLLYD